MEKLLLIGINTRELVNSASKLKNYLTFSVSYFKTADFKEVYKENHVVKQKPNQSCGFFEENFDSKELLELSKEYLEEVDQIVLSTGLTPTDFKGKYRKYKKKIIGNKDTSTVENKYKFYKKIKNEFLTPKTYKLKHGNIDEIVEILKQYEDKSFILKPIQGSGGYGVKLINSNGNNPHGTNFNEKNSNGKNPNKQNHLTHILEKKEEQNYENCGYIVQEFIEGINISSSLLATKNQAKNIMSSMQLSEANFTIENSFKYIGNILPLDDCILKYNTNSYKKKIIKKKKMSQVNENNKFNEINKVNENNKVNGKNKFNEINEISKNLIQKFNLLGSNGVDMIIDADNNENIYVIEVNPRFQGTYETIEKLLNINLLEAHIKACEGTLIDIPKLEPNKYSIKRIIYSKERVKVGNLNIKNVSDVPYKGVIIEKNQPLATIVTNPGKFNEVKNEVKIAIENINNNL